MFNDEVFGAMFVAHEDTLDSANSLIDNYGEFPKDLTAGELKDAVIRALPESEDLFDETDWESLYYRALMY